MKGERNVVNNRERERRTERESERRLNEQNATYSLDM